MEDKKNLRSSRKQLVPPNMGQVDSPATERIDWPSWPQFSEEEYEAVARVVRSNQLSAANEVKAFEAAFADFVSARYAVGVGNATQGLHLALAALGIGVGDEVVVTPYTWISSASCILMQNAVPVFCDIEDESLGIDPAKLEACISNRTRAVIVVHMFGYPARIHEIKQILDRRGIALIEDASHAHGAYSRDQPIGSIGKIGVFSLHQRKALSVGDGGILVTHDEQVFKKLYRLRSFGDEELSYNYRMSEFAAALGSVGLKKLPDQNQSRRKNYSILAEGLANCRELRVLKPRNNEQAVFYAVLLRISDEVGGVDLDARLSRLQATGIPVRKTWALLHAHPHFNPVSKPARGTPWVDFGYDGQMSQCSYREVRLPMAESLCPDRIWELYVHPPAGERELRYAVSRLLEEFR
jgi:perosamine synthetase